MKFGPEGPKYLPGETIREQLAKITKWQVEEMENTCTICYGRNAVTECSACGWWGKVPPKGNDLQELRTRNKNKN